METVLKEKDAADWVYRGEGAANLVLAYTGSSQTFVRSIYLYPFSLIVEKDIKILFFFWMNLVVCALLNVLLSSYENLNEGVVSIQR